LIITKIKHKEVKRCFEVNANGTYKNLLDAAVALLRQNYIILNAYIRESRCKINDYQYPC
jgi:hypothetical protein